MKLLAIDTSTEIASVALMVNNDMACESLPSPKVQAQMILPMIETLLASAELGLGQLDGIVFGCGPGSFTGLRIACSIAKGLAYARDLPVYPVSTLSAIAEEVRNAPENRDSPVLAVLDARMRELYWAYFPASSVRAEERVSKAESIALPQNTHFLLAGLGFELYAEVFSSMQGLSMHPKASAMIQLTQKGGIAPVQAADAQPIYIRNNVTQG